MQRLNEDPSRREKVFKTFTDEEKTAVAQEFLNRAGGDLSQVPEWARPYLPVAAPTKPPQQTGLKFQDATPSEKERPKNKLHELFRNLLRKLKMR